jgi:protein gp37
MAETTGIAWCKSTMNFWIGCSKNGPGCDGCYAEHSTPARTMAIEWGPGKPRHRTAPQTWNQLDRWNREAPSTEFAGRKGFWPVFIDSLSDFFDNEVPDDWRADAWAKIKANPNLTFLIVTKRIGNVKRMLPADWGNGYPNVWLIITVVNQSEADRDVRKLHDVPAVIRGLSVEPQLGDIDLEQAGALALDWVICGGESDQPGHPAREFKLVWARNLAARTKAAGAAFFMKQLGHKPTEGYFASVPMYGISGKGSDPTEWPEEIQFQEFPEVATC